MSNIASYYGINSKTLQRHYKHKVSGFKEWEQYSHADEYILYPENISESISIDEVSLSKGELYTVVTNKKEKGKNKKSVIAIINGTEANKIQSVLEKIPIEKRLEVKEVSMDMARNMGLASSNCFINSNSVIDRFHVVRLVMDALQHMRVKLRWKAIDEENEMIKHSKLKNEKYKAEILANGDTLKELLVRSKYLLYKYDSQWTPNQQLRAKILFEKYPLLQTVYQAVLEFRNIYKCNTKFEALSKIQNWIETTKVLEVGELNTAIYSIEHHLRNILNYFDNKSTNAYAESFNSKIKGFRANLRGVTDVKFFLFRLEKLFA